MWEYYSTWEWKRDTGLVGILDKLLSPRWRLLDVIQDDDLDDILDDAEDAGCRVDIHRSRGSRRRRGRILRIVVSDGKFARLMVPVRLPAELGCPSVRIWRVTKIETHPGHRVRARTLR